MLIPGAASVLATIYWFVSILDVPCFHHEKMRHGKGMLVPRAASVLATVCWFVYILDVPCFYYGKIRHSKGMLIPRAASVLATASRRWQASSIHACPVSPILCSSACFSCSKLSNCITFTAILAIAASRLLLHDIGANIHAQESDA